MNSSPVFAAGRLWLAAAMVALVSACDLNQTPEEAGLPDAADAALGVDAADSAVPAQGKLQLSPEPLDFADQPVGTCKTRTATVRNIGEAPLAIAQLDLQQLSPQVTVRWLSPQALAGQAKAGGEKWPLAAPLTLAPTQAAGLAVEYCRTDAAAMSGALGVAADSGAVSVAILAKEAKGEQPVQPPKCPVALAKIAEGSEVMVNTTLHLSSSGSQSPAGLAIAKYEWAVSQPAGNNQPLSPGGNAAQVSLVAAKVGTYKFCLSVWDTQGTKSCAPSCAEVLVVPGHEITVELTWSTPGDADPLDQGPGADLDLHLAHPLAQGLDRDCDGIGDPWYSNPFDAFWFNPKPDWGALGSDDDPVHSPDDVDGAGPESVSLVRGEGAVGEPVAYAVGVHSWNDHGLGKSLATVKIWAYGGLVLQLADVALEPGELWYVGRLHWPNTLNGGTKVPFEPCRQQGKTCAGGKTKTWQSSGQWCITPCYKDNAFTSVATKPMGACKE